MVVEESPYEFEGVLAYRISESRSAVLVQRNRRPVDNRAHLSKCVSGRRRVAVLPFASRQSWMPLMGELIIPSGFESARELQPLLAILGNVPSNPL